MKKGFTLLELIVVIIILGVLAILGFSQYGRMIEKSRGAEARTIIGDLRKLAIGFYMERDTVTNWWTAHIGNSVDQMPATCRASHWFSFASAAPSALQTVITATRCTADGKPPQGPSAGTLTLTSNFASGAETWGGSGGY